MSSDKRREEGDKKIDEKIDMKRDNKRNNKIQRSKEEKEKR